MIKVSIVYPADPMGVIPGGIDTCIRDILRSAPDDFEYTVLGATTDTVSRPVRTWTRCDLGSRTFNFYPAYAIENQQAQPRIPATFKHLWPLLTSKPTHDFDILQFHRIEQLLPYLRTHVPKFTFMHQDMAVITDSASDIRWKHIPGIYYKMEDWLIPKFNRVFCVHREGVAGYKKRYPDLAERFQFVPTWMNPDVFYPPSDIEKSTIRAELNRKYGIANEDSLLIFVGRIDKQKNPQLLLRSIARLVGTGRSIHLLMVGDGVLRGECETLIGKLQLDHKVSVAGILANDIVARYLRGSDVLALSSGYEGMPRCVVEALGCGVPVATTNVGEVRKVVKPGVNGDIAEDFSDDAYAACIANVLENIDAYKGQPCVLAVDDYTPNKVLAPVFDRYREVMNSAACV